MGSLFIIFSGRRNEGNDFDLNDFLPSFRKWDETVR